MHYPVIIVGGGQAGLSMSYCLKQRGLDHLIFEKHQVGQAWRSQRWDTFCLVTPNWQCQLPGFPYAGEEAQGFMGKDAIVQYVQAYADSFDAPVKTGVEVTSVSWEESQSLFTLETSIGAYTADQVVIATGAYHRPKIPRIAERLPASVQQLHSSTYKNPQSLPEGAILVVGTGQSGCQIAEDLHLAGRPVHLCVGGAPRSPRRYRGKDVVDWLDQMGYYDLSIHDHPQKDKVRAKANHYVTGRDGGREIDLRQFALDGMQLYGRLKNVQDTQLEFWDDLSQNLDQADAVAESIKKTIDAFISKNQLDAPQELPYQPAWQPERVVNAIDYQQVNIRTVIWCTGFQSDFRWIKVPVFDGSGYPGHERGVTPVRGFYFLGLPWLYTWGSGRFSGIARDANYLADYMVARQRRSESGAWSVVNEFLLGS
ncbi:MAG: MSMEG_0569 family flavin-dependent oxidoreductase [Oculatellaceae cyanobacterium Prado106]|jgi:putative flavoprotein involved in K+ transport|nr:MSMEG_0569 family flavin-dependent oxidoreductase [Oculatellaceae cyanobacterium Prado106]